MARASWRYTGTAVETVEAAVPTRALNRGDIVKASDFAIERRPKSEFASEPPAAAAEIAGLAARRAVRDRPAAAQRRPDEARDREEERHGAAALRGAGHRADHARPGAGVRHRRRHRERAQRQLEAHDPGHRHRPRPRHHPWRRKPRASPPPPNDRQPSECHGEQTASSRHACDAARNGPAGKLLRDRPAEECRRKARASAIENPTAQPGYKPVQMPMPAPQSAIYNPNSLWRNGSRAFFKDQRAMQIGDIMTVKVKITDNAKFENGTARSRSSKEDSGVTRFHRQQAADRHGGAGHAGKDPDRGFDLGDRQQGLGQPAGSLADQCRRRRHAGAAERQSRGRGQAGGARQLRGSRIDRRRHRAPGRHRERQHDRTRRRSRRRASPTADADRSPTCSNRATASR